MELNPWKDAIINELICLHSLTEELENDPEKALTQAICTNVDIALDPSVSQAAKDLIEPLRLANLDCMVHFNARGEDYDSVCNLLLESLKEISILSNQTNLTAQKTKELDWFRTRCYNALTK